MLTESSEIKRKTFEEADQVRRSRWADIHCAWSWKMKQDKMSFAGFVQSGAQVQRPAKPGHQNFSRNGYKKA